MEQILFLTGTGIDRRRLAELDVVGLMQRTVAQSGFTLCHYRHLYRALLVAACWLGIALVARAQVAWLPAIDYTKLSEILGNEMLTGEGVFISQVEAGQGGTDNQYVPDPNSNHFDSTLDPFGVEPTFVNGSAGSHPNPAVSTHATNVVANPFYGDRNGQARGSNTIVVYEANDYLRNFLNCGLNGCGSTAPDQPTFMDPSDGQTKSYVVQNHSWAGSLGSNTGDQRALRKVDYLVDQFELTTAVGVRNGNENTPHPSLDNLLAHSYNAIAVGVSSGFHAISPTTSVYGASRRKPSIVSPNGTVSSATATVSGAATLLHESLAGTNGTRSEPIRAILMAGATKAEFTNFVDPATGLVDPWTRSQSQPLDNIMGAGELNVFNNYLITEGGQFSGGTSTPTPVGAYGWDYNTVNTGLGNTRKYQFEIPAGSTATEFSAILTWNADVNPNFMSNPTLANLNLTLKRGADTVDLSNSTVENVEHIYVGPGQLVTALTPGTYTLEVTTSLTKDYGIAWRMSTLFDVPSADFNEDGDVDGLDFLAWQQNVGTLLGATHADGDADGDQDVDAGDLALFEAQYGPGAPLAANIFGVPEPGTAALSVLSILAYALTSRKRREIRAAHIGRLGVGPAKMEQDP